MPATFARRERRRCRRDAYPLLPVRWRVRGQSWRPGRLKDASSGGAGVVVVGPGPDAGQMLELHRCGACQHVQARVVRIQSRDDGRALLGCAIDTRQSRAWLRASSRQSKGRRKALRRMVRRPAA